MDEAARATEGFRRQAETSARGLTTLDAVLGWLGRSLPIVSGGVAGVTLAAVGLARNAASTAAEIGRVAEEVGISAEALSRYRYAAKIAGVENNALNDGLVALQRAIEGDSAALRAMGVATRDAAGQQRPMAAVLAEVADRFQGYTNGASEAKLGHDVFGKSFGELQPLLERGAAGLRELTDEADTFGTVVDDEAAAAARQFEEDLSRLQGMLPALTQELAGPVVQAVGEVAQEFMAARRAGMNFFEMMSGTLFNGMADPTKSLQERIAERRAEIEEIRGGSWTSNSLMEVLNPEGSIAQLEKEIAWLEDLERVQRTAADAAAARGQAAQEAGRQSADAAAAALKAEEDAEKARERGERARARAAAAAARESQRAAEQAARNAAALDDLIDKIDREALIEAEKSVRSYHDAWATHLGALDGQARALEEQVELFGLTEAQIAAVTLRRSEETLAVARANGVAPDYLAALEREVELRRQIAGAAGTLDAQRANAEAAQEAAREWERTSQEIEGAIYDAIVSGGADAGEVLERTFKALVLRPIVQPIAQAAAGMVTGALGLGAPGAGGSGGGSTGLPPGLGGGMLGNAALWAGGALGAGTMAGGFLTGMGTAMVSGAGTLGTMSAGASLMGTAGGGAAGAGMMAGAALPWIGGALALANALGAFKGPSYHSGAAVSYGADDVSALLGHKQAVGDTRVWGGFSEVDGNGGKVYADALTALARGATDTVEAALKAFGAGGSVSAYAAFGADGDDASRGALRLYDEAGKLLAANSDQLLRGAKYAKDPQKGFEQYGADAGRVVRDALIAADLPAWVDDVIGSLGDGVSVEQLSAVIGELSNFADQAADDTSLWQRATRSLHEEFASLGVEMPRTKAEFHALIQSSGDLGAELFALAPAFYELSAAVDAAFASISTTTAASVRDIEMALLDNEGKYAYLDGEIDRLLGEIQTAYDPGTIQALFEQANSKMMESWRLLDLNSMGDAEQKRVQSSFIDRFYELEALAQARLSVAPVDDAAERQAASADKAAAALDAAADRLLAATSGLGAEAAAGIREAAGDLRAAASNIQVTVRVAGGSEVGYANT
ncbi:hypothetical protein [Thauera propionica]|uniref:hypothetical protein n=1 Tax=Thauera propionica TaxID=2019431 RepID=UPI0023F4E1E0|nr:hypothetical protein [Thauera propionica]MDD3676525.1 hypothetical protein [Thauera propionica]